MKTSKAVDMCNGPLLGKIIAFAIPVMLTNLLQQLFSSVDMIVVGRFCGNNSLAAIGSTGSLSFLIVSLFSSLSIGSGILISHAIGAKDEDAIDKVLHTSVLTSIVAGFVVSFIGIAFCKKLLIAMNTPVELLDKATIYLKITFSAMPVNMLYNFCSTMLRAVGDVKRPLIYLVIAGVANLILNLILVTALKLDVAGVAIATVISQALSAVLVILRLSKGIPRLKLKRSKMHISKSEFTKIMKLGIPAGIQGIMFSISSVLIQKSVNTFGSVAVAGNSAAASIDGFFLMIMNAFQHASLTFVGQNMGASKYPRMIRSMLLCVALVSCLGIAFGIVTHFFGTDLLSIYCPNNPEAVSSGFNHLKITGSLCFFSGLMEVTLGTLRGMGYSLTTMIVALIGECGLRSIWVYTVFARLGTLSSLYASFPCSWALVAVTEIVIFIIIMKRLKKSTNTLW